MMALKDFDEWSDLVKWLEGKVGGKSFLVHGSIAMGFYGCRRDSGDVDVVAPMEILSEHSKVSKTLERNGFKRNIKKEKFGDQGALIRKYEKSDWEVDVHEVERAKFRDYLKRAREFSSKDGHTLFIIGRNDLIKLKRLRATSQDIADIECLEYTSRREREDAMRTTPSRSSLV